MTCNCSCNSELNVDIKKILMFLSGMSVPCGAKDIAAATGIDGKSVSNHLKTLKTKGYIGSPARCKYEITTEGKAAL